MVKIFIDPGHGGSDPGAVANGVQEKNITLQLSALIRKILLSEYEDVVVLMSRTGDQTVSLENRTNAANHWGADFYLSVHVNSGGGNGFESFVYSSVPRQTVTYQEIIHKNIMMYTSLADRGMKQGDYHVLRESHMDAILTENGFIDNASDAEKLKDPLFIERLARGHALGIANAFQLKGKNELSELTKPVHTVSDGFFSVQIGAFHEKSNAEKLALQAKEKGFNPLIIQVHDLYKVQIGAFKERENAEALIQKAKKEGIDAFVAID